MDILTKTSTVAQTTTVELDALFALQKQKAPVLSKRTAQERILKLKRLLDALENNADAIRAAMYADFKKPWLEASLVEVIHVKMEINHAIKHLKEWMRPYRVESPLFLFGTTSEVMPEAKGVSLIIAPWNYPFNLAMMPLVSAIAAGCTAIIKPSELTPHTSALIKTFITDLFDPSEVAVAEGDHLVSQYLLSLPFNHIFFTGSPAIGKVVMAAAAKHLTSVTLELGGKSPCIVDESADVKAVAARIAFGKWFNNGQTCIAPDYILVHESKQEGLKKSLAESIKSMYDPEGKGVQSSDSYARIVNGRHFSRVKNLLDDAVAKGATIEAGGQFDASEKFMSPTVLSNVSDDMMVMQEEIFGPLFPIVPYKTKEEAVDYIRKHEKPLALYIFTSSKSSEKYFLANTTAGATVVNDIGLHYFNADLPFGGVNFSGIGKSHGHNGFLEFTNQKAVVRQHFWLTRFISPPYTNLTKKLANLIAKIV